MPTRIEHLLKANEQGVKIDLGCGQNKQPGFIGVDYDKCPGVDIVHNLEEYPWPLPDECANFLLASHLVEHINPHGGNFIRFMDEAWRVLKVGGIFLMAYPYAGSFGYWQDPTHCNGINEATWAYFDPLEPNSGGMLYQIYKPKPWKIDKSVWETHGNMEVSLIKRKESNAWKKPKIEG